MRKYTVLGTSTKSKTILLGGFHLSNRTFVAFGRLVELDSCSNSRTSGRRPQAFPPGQQVRRTASAASKIGTNREKKHQDWNKNSNAPTPSLRHSHNCFNSAPGTRLYKTPVATSSGNLTIAYNCHICLGMFRLFVRALRWPRGFIKFARWYSTSSVGGGTPIDAWEKPGGAQKAIINTGLNAS